MEEIAERLMKPSEEEEKDSSEEEVIEEAPVAPTPPVDAKAKGKTPDKNTPGSKAELKKAEEVVPDVEEEEEEEVEYIPPFEANDYLEKAEMEPPRDPDGTHTLHENLIVPQDRI